MKRKGKAEKSVWVYILRLVGQNIQGNKIHTWDGLGHWDFAAPQTISGTFTETRMLPKIQFTDVASQTREWLHIGSRKCSQCSQRKDWGNGIGE